MSEVSPDELRRVLGHYATGVCIVAAFDGDAPVGMAVNSMTSVSLDPPLVLICPAKASTTWPGIRGVGEFCVSVMAGHHEQVSRGFAAAGRDRFDGIEWHPRMGGPAIDGAIAWLDCKVEAEHPAGDHTIVLARLLAVEAQDPVATPLVFFRGRYGTFVE
jgi:3-hydroxy-9,10-secoandrosta-1,3,5(10)-triene-9,17-dione monooxygenase reductase component